MRIEDVLTVVGSLTREELTVWVESGWVRPRQGAGGPEFDEVDVARVRLVRELRRDMELDDEALVLVLNLLDRMHGLRAQMRRLADAVALQPEEVRRAVFGACGFAEEPPEGEC